MEPPPPAVSVLTSLMCVCLSVWTYASHGRSTAALAVSAFALLSLQLLTVKQLRFSQLASSVFGLFYCGERYGISGSHGDLLLRCPADKFLPLHCRLYVSH